MAEYLTREQLDERMRALDATGCAAGASSTPTRPATRGTCTRATWRGNSGGSYALATHTRRHHHLPRSRRAVRQRARAAQGAARLRAGCGARRAAGRYAGEGVVMQALDTARGVGYTVCVLERHVPRFFMRRLCSATSRRAFTTAYWTLVNKERRMTRVDCLSRTTCARGCAALFVFGSQEGGRFVD